MRALVYTLVLLLSLSLLPAEEISFNSSYSEPYSRSDGRGILEELLSEALERLGMEARFARVPAERALLEAQQGIADGVVARVEGMEAMYPSLVIVPSATIPERDFVAFTLDPGINIDEWEDLGAYSFAYVRGWKIVEEHTAGYLGAIPVATTELAFRLLRQGRADVVINARLDGLAAVARMGLSRVTVQEPPLARMSLYPYLNARHRELAPLLAEALEEMKRDGTFDVIYEEALARFAGK